MTDTERRLSEHTPPPPHFAFRSCASLLPKSAVVADALEGAGFRPKRQTKTTQTWQFVGDGCQRELLVLLRHNVDPADYVEFPQGSGQFIDVSWSGEVFSDKPLEEPSDRSKHLTLLQNVLGEIFNVAAVTHSTIANPRFWDWRFGPHSP